MKKFANFKKTRQERDRENILMKIIFKAISTHLCFLKKKKL